MRGKEGVCIYAARHLPLPDLLNHDWPALAPHPGLSSALAKRLLIERAAWLILQEADNGKSEIVAVCVHSRGRISNALHTVVINDLDDEVAFWCAIRALEKRLRVMELRVERFSKLPRDDLIPQMPAEQQRFCNVKLYVWRLAGEEWATSISRNHKRNIHRARKSGVHVVTASDSRAIDAHIELLGDSLKRRAERGEPTSLATDARAVQEILSLGEALLFQALLDTRVLSSKIVFLLGRFGYYHSGGTSEQGMKIGASHFLMHAIAADLRTRGALTLNLDLASRSAGGLGRYKAEFGADEWHVTNVACKNRSVAKLVANAIRVSVGNLVRVRGE